MSERQGVEIDHCPNCRGVWLDRGELDKLVEMSARQAPAHAATPSHGAPPPFVDSDYGEHSRGYRRRKSWLGEIFEITAATAARSAWAHAPSDGAGSKPNTRP
jgi:hypothetical protein